jgi:hypothetical protein
MEGQGKAMEGVDGMEAHGVEIDLGSEYWGVCEEDRCAWWEVDGGVCDDCVWNRDTGYWERRDRG